MIAARQAAIRAIGSSRFDVAIIGGGINGAAIADVAARTGLSVALFEKGDFACGTSSRSSRLIHGGIRYLEYGYLGLVFESSRERKILSQLAPHLVRPLGFTWPVYRGARIPLWKLRAGLVLYDTLSLFANFRRHSSLKRAQLLENEPRLASENLVGGARYFDAATDDARLTLANVRAAAGHGAVVLNYCEVRGVARIGDDTVVTMFDVHSGGEEFACRARVAVNAAGPWSDNIIKLVKANRKPVVQGTKGVHIAVPRERIGNNAAITMVSPADGRVLFVLPSGATAIIGTTETNTAESPDEVRASPDDVRYLLNAANHYFPEAQLVTDDVVSTWAGIRPLGATFFKETPGSASREHELHWEQDAMLTVSGGKLTTYRVVARDAVNALVRKLGGGAGAAMIEEQLPGSNMGSSFEDEAAAAQRSVIDADVATQLVQSHGSEWRDVWGLAQSNPELARRIHPDLPWLRAEIVYAVRVEMALALSDVLLRRTHIAFETRDSGRSVAGDVASIMANELGWTETERQTAIKTYERDVARIFGATR